MAFNALMSRGNVLSKIYFHISSGSKSPSKILRLSNLKKLMVKGYLYLYNKKYFPGSINSPSSTIVKNEYAHEDSLCKQYLFSVKNSVFPSTFY